MAYIYETHLHTVEGSKCGRQPARDYVRFMRDRGFQGFFVTDHFTGTQPCPDPALPWPKWVDAYCLGYEHAREEGAKVGVDVFFGWEQTMRSDEYLIYGLDREWLLQHPECRRWTRQEMFQAVDAAGALVVHAHPFRERGYIPYVQVHPYACHAIEAANAGNEPYMDVMATKYATALGKPMTAGSDIHWISDATIFGVAFDTPLTSAMDYAQRIRNGIQPGLVVPQGRCVEPADAINTLQAVCYDNNGREMPMPIPVRKWE